MGLVHDAICVFRNSVRINCIACVIDLITAYAHVQSCDPVPMQHAHKLEEAEHVKFRLAV